MAAGKGDTPRPVDRKKYDASYARIFKKNVSKKSGTVPKTSIAKKRRTY